MKKTAFILFVLLLFGFFKIPKSDAVSFLPLFPFTDPGIPTHKSITGIYWNPAIIGQFKGNSVLLSISPINQSSTYSPYTISSTTGLPDPNGDISYGKIKMSDISADFFIGAITDLNSKKINLGLAIFSFNNQNFGTKSNGIRYYSTGRNISNIFISPVISIKLHRKFYLGFGLSYVYTKADLAFKRDLYLRDSQPSSGYQTYEAGGINDEEISIKTIDNNLGFNVGFFWQIKKWLYAGFSYRSQIRSVDDAYIRSSGTGSITRFYDDIGYVTKNGNAKYILQFPDYLSLGLKMRLSKNWWGDFTLHYARWSVFKNTKIILSGEDFLGSDLTNRDLSITEYYGMNDILSPQFTFFYKPYKGYYLILSTKYSPPATNIKWIKASNIDNHSFDFLFSTGFDIISNLKFKISYAFEFMIPVDLQKSGYDPSLARNCLEDHVDIVWGDSCQETYEGKALPSTAGKYTKYVHQFGFALEYSF